MGRVSTFNYGLMGVELNEVADIWAREVLGFRNFEGAALEGYTVDNFEDDYYGSFDSVAEFAEDNFEFDMDDIHESMRGHIDWQGVWDCELRHYFTDIKTDDYRVHIFRTD